MADIAKKQNNAKKPVGITETILRDAHQSLIATRMTTEQMLPIVEKMDQVGYHSVECWGGATFDASLRFLKEDPWERLRKFRAGFKNTKLQMLFRGQNILGYRPYADDVVEYFVQKSIAYSHPPWKRSCQLSIQEIPLSTSHLRWIFLANNMRSVLYMPSYTSNSNRVSNSMQKSQTPIIIINIAI